MNLRPMHMAYVVKNKVDVNNYIVHIAQAWVSLLRLTNEQTSLLYFISID